MTDRTPKPTKSRDLARRSSHARKVALRSSPSTATTIRKLNEAISAPAEFDDTEAPVQRLAYGVARVEGKLIYGQIIRGGPLYAVYHLARGEATDELTWEIDDNSVFPSAQSAGGRVDFGIFAGKAHLRFKPGNSGQDGRVPFFSTGDFDQSTARGTDQAWAACRFSFDPDIFLGGTPKLALVGRWGQVRDVRDSFKGWSQNAALILYDYLTRSRIRGGVGVPDTQLNIQSFVNAADICDEIADTRVVTGEVIVTATTFDSITLLEKTCPFQWGDRVRLVLGPGQSLPSGLFEGTDYYVIVVHDRTNEDSLAEIKLATSYQAAVRNIPITNGTLTTGFTINKTGEPRYSIGAVFEDRDDKGSVIRNMLQAMAGRFVLRDGEIHVFAGAAQAPGESIGLDLITSPVEVAPKLEPRERFNTVIGQFRSPLNLYRTSDYPAVTSQTFLDIDGEQIVDRYDLPFVTRSGQAQRLAAIRLGQARQELRLSFSSDLRSYKARAGDVAQVTVPSLGLTDREMRVNQRALALGFRDGALQLSLDYALEATDASVYDFDPITGETLALPGPVATVPDPRIVLPPGQPNFSEQIVPTAEGQGVRNRVTIVWEASTDPFVRSYRVVYGLTADQRFEEINEVRELQLILDDLPPGNTEFRIFARNSFGNISEPVIGFFDVRGLIDPPQSLTNFGGQIVGVSVFMQWDRSPDLDVRIGGGIELRHHTDESVGSSDQSLFLTRVPGNGTSAQVPFKRGTYYIRAIDEGGRFGPFTAWSTEGVAPVQRISVIAGGAFTGTDGLEDEATFDEGGAGFPSTNPANTLIVNAQDELELDIIGGEVAQSGLYFYSAGVQFINNVRVTIETLLKSISVDLNDVFNDRIGPVNDYVSWNSLSTVGAAEAEHQLRFARVGGAFGSWRRIDSNVLFGASFEFRILATSVGGAAQIRISEAKIFFKEDEFQRASQLGQTFLIKKARMPLLTLDNDASAQGVSHQITMPFLEINADLSDTADGDLLGEPINQGIVFCVGSAPSGSTFIGDDLAQPQEADLRGATFDAPHPAIGWRGMNKSVRTDRAVYNSTNFQAAFVNTKNYSWAFFGTLEDLDANATFLTAPWDDDAHISPFSNLFFRRASTTDDQATLWFTSGVNTEFEQSESGGYVFADQVARWFGMVRDENEFRFYVDGVRVETDVDPSGLAANWNQAAGEGNTIVLGARNAETGELGPSEAYVGAQHVNAVWSRSLTDAEMLELVDNPLVMFGRPFTEPRRPIPGNVSNVGKRLDTPAAVEQLIVPHTHDEDSMYVFVFVTSSETTADTPDVSVDWQIASVSSGIVTEITPDTDADLDTRDGVPTIRVFRIVGATKGVGAIFVDVSFSGAGLYRTGAAAVVDIKNDGGSALRISSREDDPATNPTSNDFIAPLQTPLSQLLRFHATRGAGRSYTSAENFQRELVNTSIGAGQSFDFDYQLEAKSRSLGGVIPMDLAWSGGGTDNAVVAIEILPEDWLKPTIRQLVTETASQPSGQVLQAQVNIKHRPGSMRALLVMFAATNTSGPATVTPTITWEVGGGGPSGTLTNISDTTPGGVKDTNFGRPGIQAFLITSGDVGDGTLTVSVDMGGGEIAKGLAVYVFDMDNVGSAGASDDVFDSVPGSSTSATLNIVPESNQSKIFMLSACQIEGGQTHVYTSGGLGIDTPLVPTLETGTADHDTNASLSILNVHDLDNYTLRASWTNGNEAATYAIEIKP